MPVLVVEKGASKGQKLAIKPTGEVSVGTAPASNLRVEDALVNEKHFTISFSDDTWWLSDAGSRNGTWLNGEPVEDDIALKPGDQIEVGETVLTFTADADSKRIADPMVGQTVGGYRIIERVGRGGMGVVYKATQLSLNREVALKILGKKFVQDQTFIQMFVEEARSAAAMNHPNIVQAYDVGKAKDNYYFSMEFMGGGSVQDVLSREGRITPGRALGMMIGAAKGLEFAEKKHIVHCDIKPDNLMLTEDGSVKIGDLGLSKNLGKNVGKDGKGGKNGNKGDTQIFGTPHFVAPEQVQGKPLDHRTDLYSLGASFFRMVSGRTPFTGDTARELVTKHLKEPVPTLVSVDPDLPKALDPIVQKLMAKEPGDRYQSANDLVTDLRRAMVEVGADGGYTDLIPGVVEVPGKSKLGMLIGVALVAVIAVIVAIVAVSSGGNGGSVKETPEQERARLDREAAQLAEQKRIEAAGEAGKAFQDLLHLQAKHRNDQAHPSLEKAYTEFLTEFPDSTFAKDIKALLDAIPGIRNARVADTVVKAWAELTARHIDGKELTDPAAIKALRKFIGDTQKIADETRLDIPQLQAAKDRLAKAEGALAASEALQAQAAAAFETTEQSALALITDEKFGDARAKIDAFDLKKYAGTGAVAKHKDLVSSWEQALGLALRKRGDEAKTLEEAGTLDEAIAKWVYVRDRFGVEKPANLAAQQIARLEAAKESLRLAALAKKIAAERILLGRADQDARPPATEYDFGSALRIYEQLRDDGAITTPPVLEALNGRIRDFGHAVAAMHALIGACNGPSKGNEFALPEGTRGDSPKIDSANDKGLGAVVNFGGQKAKIQVDWPKFSPAELWALFRAQVPASSEVALQRAVLALLWRLGNQIEDALAEAERSPDDAIREQVRYYRARLTAAPVGDGEAEAAAAKLRGEAISLMRQADKEPDPLKAKALLEEAIKLLQELKAKFPETRAAKGRPR